MGAWPLVFLYRFPTCIASFADTMRSRKPATAESVGVIFRIAAPSFAMTARTTLVAFVFSRAMNSLIIVVIPDVIRSGYKPCGGYE